MGEFAVSRALYRGALFLIAFVVLLLVLRELTTVVMQVFAACIIAAAISPMVNSVTTSERAMRWRWRPPRALAVLVIYLVLGVIFFVLGVIIFGGLVNDIGLFIESLPTYAANARAWIDSVVARLPTGTNEQLNRLITEVVSAAAARVADFARGLLNFIGVLFGFFGSLLNIIFILMMALYLTVDGQNMRDYLLVFAPASRRPQFRRLLTSVVERLGGWVQGQLLLCLIVGGGAWLGLQLIGVPYAVLLGLIWAVAEFIPGIGPFIAAAPTILLGFLAGPTTGVLAAAFTLAWSQVESNVITPKVLGSAAEIHPLVVLVSILVGAELLGFAGAFLAIPFAAVVGVLVDEVHNMRLRDQLAISEPGSVGPPEELVTVP
jgi:predicted PurR-regulated permease PerM